MQLPQPEHVCRFHQKPAAPQERGQIASALGQRARSSAISPRACASPVGPIFAARACSSKSVRTKRRVTRNLHRAYKHFAHDRRIENTGVKQLHRRKNSAFKYPLSASCGWMG